MKCNNNNKPLEFSNGLLLSSFTSSSRSIDAEVFKRPKGPIVIPAQPKQEPKNQLYSVYGSPDINYSALYERPPAAPQSRTTKRINGIRNDGREFYLNSALDSRYVSCTYIISQVDFKFKRQYKKKSYSNFQTV